MHLLIRQIYLPLVISLVTAFSPAYGQLQPFFAPARPTGSMEVKLHPMENVTSGSTRLITFGVPFPRGSMTAAGLETIRVLRGGVEIPAHVDLLTPWRHLTNNAVDGQSVRIARVQIQMSMNAIYPAFETVVVEWGQTARTLDVAALIDPQQGWHRVTSGTFVQSDGISEPDVYALLPKDVLALGVLNMKQHDPFATHIPETRDNATAMDNIEHWPGYEEADRALKNNFYTSINQDDPLVTVYGSGQLVDYKNDSEPWLYDRSSAFFILYLKSGYLRALREAVRSTQFYRTKLYGPNVSPATSAGLFSLKTPNPATPNGGNDAMYAYAECFAYDLWLTGNPQSVEPIRWVATTVNALAENTHWSPSLGAWTERHTALATLANVVAFEVTGDSLYRQTVLTHAADYVWHQNGAGGQLPAERLDGGLYHYGRQHGDGEPEVLVASHWMTTLTVDAMVRAYGISEDAAIAGFIIRAARFQSTALIFDDEHDFDTYAGALRYPGYMIRFDGAPDVLDGHDTSAINHALDVASSVAWGAYFQHLLHGTPDAEVEAAARDLYVSYDAGVNHWIRPSAPSVGVTAFRVNPARKYAWEHRPSGSFSWVMNQINEISPPPEVTITSPAPNTMFTAPANILIQATATSPNADIVKVEFFDGSVKLGEDDTAPYAYQWNGVIADLQGHVITAKATTSLGVVGQSVGVPLDVRAPGRPELTITSPLPGAIATAPANITLLTSVVPQGGTPVARVLFMRGYVPEYEDTTAPYTYAIPTLLHGTYEFQVLAFDIHGGYDIETVTITVQTPSPPTVTLTEPAAGAQTARGGVLRLRATAGAPGSAVTRVGFRVDNVPIGEDLTAPYELDYQLSNTFGLGNHIFTARAYETNGGIADSNVTVQVVEIAPIAVAFDAPAVNASIPFPAAIQMQASASAPGSSITRVDFYANNNFAGSDTTPPYTASYVPTSVRQWELVARAFDAFGRRSDALRIVNVVGPSAPVVALTSPANGAVFVAPSTATLTASASVFAATITRVQFYEGSTLLGEDTTEPFEFTTPPLTLGEHTYFARATSSTGLTASSTGITITAGAANSPVTQITAPRFSGPQFGTFTELTFKASAAHTGGGTIARVEFWLDNVRLAQDFEAPYEFVWQVGTNYGYRELHSRAFDTNGVEGRSANAAFELIQPPIVTVAAPVAGSVVLPGVPTTISADVIRGTYSISEVRFLINGAVIHTDTIAPYTAPWTPASTGNHTLTARVYDSRGLSPTSSPVVVSAQYSARQAWRFSHFGTYASEGFAADDADPDNDGVANFLEWILGRNPLGSSPAESLLISRTADHIALTFSRTDASEDVQPVIVQWTNDLTTWHDIAVPAISAGPDSDGVVVEILENGTAADTVTVFIPTLLQNDGMLHARIKAVLAP